MATTPDPAPPARGTCLLVDDEADVARILSFHLHRLGFAVTVAPTLDAARRLLEDRSWAVVVLDVLLPDGDGRDLLPALRALADPPKVIIASVLMPYDLAGHSADAYLAKPFRGVNVCRALETVGLV